MPKGKVKRFGARRGCGFIVRDDGGADGVVHTVGRAGFGRLSEGRHPACDPNRDTGRRVAALDLRAVG
jgi:cold shock CspA family protein